MDGWQIIVENMIREAVEQGKFANLEGAGKPLDLQRNPFEDPLAPTLRRMLRDNGATHPLIEARRVLQAEIDTLRRELRRAWAGYCRCRSAPAWDAAVLRFRQRAGELNKHIKLNNLHAPLANFHVPTLNLDAEIHAAQHSGE